jgi:hypothetical protein
MGSSRLAGGSLRPALICDVRFRHHQKRHRALDGLRGRAYVARMTLHRSLLTALLATASSTHSFGQAAAPAPAAGAAVPAPVPLSTPAPLPSIPFENASFEQPVVEKRTLEWEGGNPKNTETSSWSHFLRRPGQGEGALNIGMTNEIARTGKQSIYLDFAGITGTGKTFKANLMTQLLPVQPKKPYRVGMWGRMDKERPLTLDQRRPFLRMQFEFYKEDEETSVGETEYRVMRIPGSLKRLLFTSSQWSRAYGIVRAPSGAALMKVSYEFEVPNEDGKTDGTLFFDDAFAEEIPWDFPIDASDDVIVESNDADPTAADEEEDPAKAGAPVKAGDPVKAVAPVKAGDPAKAPVPIR